MLICYNTLEFCRALEFECEYLWRYIMAVPKGKVSKARRDKRRANWKAAVPTLVECPHCHEKKIAHRVCKNCGYYDGEQVVNMDKKESK